MGDKATTLEEQIACLRKRGMTIEDEHKAREVLFDIGCYRLGFYWFPFEVSHPMKGGRDHSFSEGANFDDAVKLYYLDFDLRNLLLKVLSRIEIALRTKVIYIVSNAYPDKPTWFADPVVVGKKQAQNFQSEVYGSIKDKPVIVRHHRAYINDRFAPAWKTLEFVTLGQLVYIFNSIKDERLQQEIALSFGVRGLGTFKNYLEALKDIRNACAHGNVLYDYTPQKSISKGPAMLKGIGSNQNLNGALHVVIYMLGQISCNREEELRCQLRALVEEVCRSHRLREILKSTSGIVEGEYSMF